MEFVQPAAASGDSVKPGDLLGHLCIFRPTEYRSAVATSFGDSDVVVCDVVDLDEGVEHNGVWFFNVALRSALKPNIGKQVLGRVGQGVAKPGKSAPYIILAADKEEDYKKATAYIAGQVQSPAAAEVKASVTPAVNADDPAVQALIAALAAQKK